MTHNIRKQMPAGTEYFRISGDFIQYHYITEDDEVMWWNGAEWIPYSIQDFHSFLSDPDVHSIYPPVGATTLALSVLVLILLMVVVYG
jgi:hypothetical protein